MDQIATARAAFVRWAARLPWSAQSSPRVASFLAAGFAFVQRRVGATAFAACLAVGSIIAVRLRQDGNWDLLNYHVYNVFWWLEGRRDRDFLVNGINNYLSPLLDIPFYLLAVKWLPTHPKLVTAIQGLYFGALIHVVLTINTRILGKLTHGTMMALIATTIGITGSATFPQAGATFNDVQVSLLILWGVVILLPLLDRDSHVLADRRALGSGVLFGLAAGLKLTGLVFAPAIAVAVLAFMRPLRRSIWIVVLFCVGWGASFLISYGWLGYDLWQSTGNPLFPFLNGVFRSDWYPPVSIVPYYRISSPLELLTFPFSWVRLQDKLITEVPFRDARFALGFLSLVVLIAAAVLHAVRPTAVPAQLRALNAGRLVHFVSCFVVLSYIPWLWLLDTLRYAIPIEVLLGTLIVLACNVVAALSHSQNIRRAGAVVLGLAVLAALAVHTRYPAWVRRDYGPRFFVVDVPPIPPGSMIVVHHAPLAYILPFVRSSDWSSVGVTTMTLPGFRVYEETKKRIADHTGPLFILYASLEPVFLRDRLDELGVTWDNESCRPVTSNLSFGLLLCEVRRRPRF